MGGSEGVPGLGRVIVQGGVRVWVSFILWKRDQSHQIGDGRIGIVGSCGLKRAV
jgi:hypothetical protein